MIIDKRHLDDIARRMELIRSSRPQADLAAAKRGDVFVEQDAHHDYSINCLQRESLDHSAQIEISYLDQYDSTMPERTRRSLRRRSALSKRTLRDAWHWGHTHYKTLEEHFIQTLAAKIDPELFPGEIAPYRTDNVRILGGIYIPPRAEEVPNEIYRLIIGMGSQREMHPVETAAYLHFHVVRIHPFSDTNGRTSRMLQNLHLAMHGYPPAIIHRAEKTFYNQLLEESIGAYKERTAQDYRSDLRISLEERRFFDYIASKVTTSLDTVLETINQKRRH
ncbi:MAG: Fic family protein [Nanoarchaeota archaeon]